MHPNPTPLYHGARLADCTVSKRTSKLSETQPAKSLHHLAMPIVIRSRKKKKKAYNYIGVISQRHRTLPRRILLVNRMLSQNAAWSRWAGACHFPAVKTEHRRHVGGDGAGTGPGDRLAQRCRSTNTCSDKKASVKTYKEANVMKWERDPVRAGMQSLRVGIQNAADAGHDRSNVLRPTLS